MCKVCLLQDSYKYNRINMRHRGVRVVIIYYNYIFSASVIQYKYLKIFGELDELKEKKFNITGFDPISSTP